MRVLLTGFGPFGEVVSNPTERIARALGGVVLPTSFARAETMLFERLSGHDAVLMLGVAETSEHVRIELVGRNHDQARIPDVDGAQPVGAIVEDGPEVLPVTLDVAAVEGAIADTGLRPQRSDSAGAYVCNHLLYRVLHRLQGTSTRAGFLHLPADRHTHGTPRNDRSLDPLCAAVEAALRAL